MVGNKYAVALIGYGGMGHWHAEVLNEFDEIFLYSIFDTDSSKIEEAKETGYHTYTSFEEVLADEKVDILLLAVPNDWHKPYAVKALLAGKNVISEKPVTICSSDLQEMIDAANQSGKLFTVHQNRRWDEDFLTVKKIYNEGLLGDIFSIESRVHGSRGIPGDWRKEKAKGGGMMLDWGVHLIDQILQIIPEKVSTVYAKMHHITNYEVDDGFRMILTFESGKTVLIEVGTSNFINMPRWYVQGENGTALIQNFSSDAQIVNIKSWDNSDAVPVKTAAGLTKTMAPRTDDTIKESVFPREKLDFHGFYHNIAAVLDGKEEQIVRHDEIMRVMKLMEAAFRSDECNQVVTFEE